MSIKTEGMKTCLKWTLLTAFAILLVFIPISFLRIRKHRCVPNVIHFYRGPEEAGYLSGASSLCLRAALAFHSSVYVHSADPNATLKALRAMGTWPPSLRVLPAPQPKYPFKGPDASLRAARLVSLDILRTYGGIFLGNDVYLLQSLDQFRDNEMTVSLRNGMVQTQLLIAKKDARFLKAWLASYLHYKPEEEIMTSLPLDSAKALKEAVIPVYKDIFFLSDYIDTGKVLAIQLVM